MAETQPSTTHTTAPVDKRKTAHPLTFGLSFVASLGVILIIVALGIGVTQGSAADGNAVNALLVAGFLLMIGGIGAWVGVTQPFNHFDDISQPKYTGHAHHDEPGEVHADEKALTAVVTDAHGHVIETRQSH
jgi:ABC-type nickel/cobalt efflux system permease component RcnA